MLSTENLLKPRYLVIADYPNSEYKVGEIKGNIGDNYASFFATYPHLFRPLQWWELRSVEEMPEYVKHSGGTVYKPIWLEGVETENGLQPHRMNLDGDIGGWQVIHNVMCFFEPATEQEYATYTTTKTKNK